MLTFCDSKYAKFTIPSNGKKRKSSRIHEPCRQRSFTHQGQRPVPQILSMSKVLIRVLYLACAAGVPKFQHPLACIDVMSTNTTLIFSPFLTIVTIDGRMSPAPGIGYIWCVRGHIEEEISPSGCSRCAARSAAAAPAAVLTLPQRAAARCAEVQHFWCRLA